MDRRQFLTVGSLALGGFSLPSLLAAREGEPSNSMPGKSVIFLFQQGGPSQFETFDPKPAAPSDLRTVTDTIRTALPGVLFGEHFPQLARLADKLTVVRSFQTSNAEHNIKPIVSPDSLNATLGAIYSRVVGATHPTTGMPTNAVLFPQAVCADVARGQGRGDLAATGAVGNSYAPFVPGGTGQILRNLRISMPIERFSDRRELVARFDTLRRSFESEAQFQVFDRYQEQAAEVLLSGRVADALDLTKEDQRVVDRYDTARFVRSHNWASSARGRRGYYTGHAKSIGKMLLLARRLCEAGCGFVTIHSGYEGIWDMHADTENLNMVDGMNAVGPAFDHAVASFITDLESRGLSDKILLVCAGEMGRTPRVNRNGGRDHWARLAPLMVYGGNSSRGRVVGQSTRDGGEPATENFGPRNLISSIFHSAFDIGQLRLQPAMTAIARLGEPETIPGVV